MLAVLLIHTLVLSLWLANSDAVKKQANFKGEEPREKSGTLATIKIKFTNFKDSTEASQVAIKNGFNTRLK